MIFNAKAKVVFWLGMLIAGLVAIEFSIDDYDSVQSNHIKNKYDIDKSNYLETLTWRDSNKAEPLKLVQSKAQKEFNHIIEDTIYFSEQTKQYDRASEAARKKLKQQFINNQIDNWLFIVEDIKNNQKDPANEMNSHRDSFSIVSLYPIDLEGNDIVSKKFKMMTSKLLRISSDVYYSKLYKELALIRVGDLVEVGGHFKKSSELHFHSSGKTHNGKYADYHKDMVFYIDIKTIKPLLTKDELLKYSQ